METNKITKTELEQFQIYCDEFYGTNGIYKDQLKGGFTFEWIKNAIRIYLEDLNRKNTIKTWGGGDSVDRERVRTILEESIGL